MGKKIALYGAGNVGATTAYCLAQKELGDLALFDTSSQIAAGKALDLQQSGPAFNFDASITGSHDPSVISDADIVIVSAGIPRRKDPISGQYPSRTELIKINQAVITEAAENIKKYAPNSIILMVTNPIEAMCHVAKEVTGFPTERIIGLAGALDTTRYRTFIAGELGVSVKEVHGIVIGGHGDTMVPLPNHTTVSGIPVTDLLGDERLAEITHRTKHAGGEIVGLLGYSGYYAPAAAIAIMVESILKGQKRLIPCITFTSGEYGYKNLFIGLPVILGQEGVEAIIELTLKDEDKRQLSHSASTVSDIVSLLGY